MIDDADDIAGEPMPDDSDVPALMFELPPAGEVLTGTFDVEKLADELRAAGIIERVRGLTGATVEIDPLLSAEDRAALQRVLEAHVP